MILHATEAGSGEPLVLLHGLFGAGRNFGALQRALAPRARVVALDLRNHGASAHDPAMNYAVMAADVLETLQALAALPAMVLGHSMGGKVAMRAALDAPEEISRLLVADIAPVRYAGSFAAYAAAMGTVPMHPGLTRAEAEAALAPAVPDAGVRGFLLQNLQFGAHPRWRIGLAEITAALPAILDWTNTPGARFGDPAWFVAGAQSDYILPEYRPGIRELFPAARFITVKQAGHWLHADNQAGFQAVVEAFVAG